MASTGTMFRGAARPLLRQAFRPTTTTTMQQSQRQMLHSRGAPRFGWQQKTNGRAYGRRWQSTAAGAEQSWFKRMWESEVGIKTVHFWAPVMKWCLVIAGIADFARPAEKLSFTQNFALTCTGLIWTRWCFIIRPRNVLLAAVNFFLAIVGIIQVSRIAMYEMAKDKTITDVAKDVKDDVKEAVEEVKP